MNYYKGYKCTNLIFEALKIYKYDILLFFFQFLNTELRTLG